jgi:transcription elongation factor GreA
MSDRIPMTLEGYNKIKAEIEELEVQMSDVTEKIAEARAEGDLSENAEYHGQRERLGMLQARANEKRNKLACASIVDPTKLPKGEVVFGAKVRVKDLDLDDEEEFTLVGAGEEDYDAGKINITSPIGQGLLGKKVGEQAEIQVPNGVINFEVLDIAFE